MGTVANIMVGREMIPYSKPYNSANALPADTVPYGTAWSDSWVNRGYTQEGISVSVSTSMEGLMVDQEIDEVLILATSRTVTLSGNLAEWTPENIQIGTGQGTISTTPPSSGVRGFTDFDLIGAPTLRYDTWGMDMRHQGDGEAVRVGAWRVQADGSDVQWTHGIANDNAKVPFSLRCLPDPANSSRVLKIHDISPALA